jgi:hypothetical protein
MLTLLAGHLPGRSHPAETALPQRSSQWRKLSDRGLQDPAEDFATGMITYKNPETGQIVKAQFTNSWMFEKQGLRLFMDGMGPGYAFEVNT